MPESKTCETCKRTFIPDEGFEYTRSCLVCWKKEKGYTLTKADLAFERLQQHFDEKVGALEKAVAEEKEKTEAAVKKAKARAKGNSGESTLTGPRLKALIRLCHPDKHGNSELATEVTKWLLDLREKT